MCASSCSPCDVVRENYQTRRARRIEATSASEKSNSRIRGDGVRWRDAHSEFVQGAACLIEDQKTETTWENTSWDEIRKAALELATRSVPTLSDEVIEGHILEAAAKWDGFYDARGSRFFKDRSYLGRAFSELCVSGHQQMPRAMEIGCGVGNSLFPLLELNPQLFVFALDCSAKAIELLKDRLREEHSDRVRAFVCDISREEIPEREIVSSSVDFATMIFTLSAIAPRQMDCALSNVNRKLKVGGLVFFRDYGLYDMTHVRLFAKKAQNQLGENFYKRADGTFSYFFSVPLLRALFEKNGFETLECDYDARTLLNRKRKIKMDRVWIQGKFAKVRNV
ncbi:tRNA N(3)-methylcytidine methyltransferase METTL6-like [Schistocerca gregaria]|uniref:tRNA N(3)-methylcytidine methyltransferase METTL6-like n=1 Tax=Schistocerca gregaria TaxID=7010 RepID=UPI00211F06CC|nr:tRNA N(3)-methylcytidine methyltransferase METTL6-like [Schistocerca gregaria]